MGVGSNGRSVSGLNPGELQCMLLVGDRLTSKEIAKRLGISPHTVDQRIRHVLRLTGLPSRREAARLVRARIEEDHIETPAMHRTAPDQRLRGDRWRLPFATRAGELNQMGTVQRIGWIIVIALGAFAATIMYLAGLESLGRILQQH